MDAPTTTTWVDLLDPTPAELQERLPGDIHTTVFERLEAQPRHDDEPRPRLEAHGDYVFGVLVVPVLVPKEREVIYQEIDVVVSRTAMVTVRKTPPGHEAISLDDVCRGA